MSRPRMSMEERLGRQRAHQLRTRDTKDPEVKPGREQRERVDLGLALLSRVAKEGARFSRYDIACWCGCTNSNIYNIERRALVKLANHLSFGRRKTFGREVAA